MKRMHIICLFLFVGISVYLGAYAYARIHFRDSDYYENRFLLEETDDLPTQDAQEAAANNELVCNLTTFLQENYDAELGILTEEKINTPVELLGISRDKLIIYMKQYMKNPSKEDSEKGLIAFELISFSRDKVVWRKTYSRDKDNVEFYGKAENGYLIIYLEDGTTLYDYTTIKISDLSQEIQKELIEGIHFEDTQALYDFLETYTS